jgi:hypothetical protein
LKFQHVKHLSKITGIISPQRHKGHKEVFFIFFFLCVLCCLCGEEKYEHHFAHLLKVHVFVFFVALHEKKLFLVSLRAKRDNLVGIASPLYFSQ